MRRTALALLCLASLAGAQERPVSVADPELMARRLKLAPGLRVDLWAQEPLLRNPVAIAFDERGRLFAAESFRRHTSLLDIHMRPEWIDDDLACRRHEDLVAYHRKRMGERAAEWTKESERIRILEDRDGDGKADHAATFSEGYSALGEGIGAGVLVRGGEAWYACIPNLWSLRDTDGDGRADVRKALFTGFGVHLGASGHDMHGLRFGPDGKLYWSHGDRGFHVEAQGKTFSFPDGGGVFRCNPDGSDLELVCVGLRNPQELAFDAYGNLFTGDNNISKAPDAGETCRWTYVVEGADYGWRIGYQFMPDGGAWCAEEQWRLEAAFQVPHVARLGHGPSGVTYHPGVAALPERYQDHFFMCDYPGGIYAFRMKPRGASFEMVGLHRLAWEVSAPDVEFGPDGALYMADWVGLWDKVDKGRIWRLAEPAPKDPLLGEVRALIAEGMGKREVAELVRLLAHRDQRIRQAAQFELAARKAHFALVEALEAGRPQLARIHAIWGLGQLGRAREVEPLLGSNDPEIRAQAAKVLGNTRSKASFDALLGRLKDESPRVRFFAAMGLGKLGKREAIPAILEFLRANDLEDRMLQHAGIMALAWIGDAPAIAALSRDPSEAVRLAALVALRKLERPEVAGFLKDKEPRVRLEAARAIYDTPIPAAFGALTEHVAPEDPERLLLRQVNALYRTGGREALAIAASAKDFPVPARVEALQLLGLWEKGLGRDRLLGLWRPVPPRPREEAVQSIRPRIGKLLEEAPAEVAAEALRLARALGLEGLPLAEILANPNASGGARAEALRLLVEQNDPGADAAVAAALQDRDEPLAREAVRHFKGPAARLEEIAASPGPLGLPQAAIARLGERGEDEALGRLLDHGLSPALLLDWIEAARKRPALKERLARLEAERPRGETGARYPELQQGGDPAAGRRIFLERSDVQCVRCHKAGGEGGSVGPDLARIGAQKDAGYLLEALLWPNKAIAEGWGQTAFRMADDSVEVGRVESETALEVALVLGDGARKRLAKTAIRTRKPALSAMPDDAAKSLSPRDLRDLVAFLSGLR